MSNNTTSGLRSFGGIALLLLAGCAWGGADPDPRQSQAWLSATRAPVVDDAPVLVVARIPGPSEPAAAPSGESMERREKPTTVALQVVVGQNAAHVIDSRIEQEFLGGRTDLEGTFHHLTDRDAIETLMLGNADFAVIGGKLSIREQHAGLQQTPIGVELFAVAVAHDSPLRSLSSSQVRQIFTGQIQDWQQLGIVGNPVGPIVPVVPADPKLAERAARAMIPGDNFTAAAVRGNDRQVADQTLQNSAAIGIVRLTDGAHAQGLKLLLVDWVAPSAETFGYGTYTFGLPVHLVTSGAPTGEAQRFLDSVRSEAGRTLLGAKLCLP